MIKKLKIFCFLILLYGYSKAQDITQGEYFIDTDPGVGLATPLTSFTQNDTVNITENISLTGYNAGFHNLYIRFKKDNGTWTVIDARSFFISSANNADVDSVVSAETFIDTDPGVGNGTAIAVSPSTINATISTSVPTTGYLSGFHTLYFRAKNKAGVWNVIDNKSFFLKPAETPVTEITKLEYFVDSDPGVGLAYNIPIPGMPNDTVILNQTLLVPCLNNGTHYFWLRAKNNLGVWNVVNHDTLTVGGAMAVQPIASTGPDTVCIPGTVTMFADSSVNVTYQWLESGTPIGGATFAKYTATVSGNYSLRQTCAATGGNVVSNIKNVIVNDVPDITFCPSVIPLNNDGGLCSAIVTYTSATAIGSVPLPVITYSQNSGTTFNVGTTTVYVVATNRCGIDSCNFNVVVNDNEIPSITCPLAVTVNCQESQLPASTGSATATDNCDPNPSVSYSDSIVAGNCSGNYLIRRTWIARDQYNNSNSCLQIITIQDTTKPGIVCPNDTVLETNQGDCTAIVLLSQPVTFDNCGMPALSNNAPAVFPVGNTIVTWTTTDGCNNSVSCTQNVLVTPCINLHLTMYIEGLYLGDGEMIPLLFNSSISQDPTACDTILVELRDSVIPDLVVTQVKGLLHVDGTLNISIPGSLLNGSYYILVRHRNALETWSKYVVAFNATDTYFDFTTP